MIDNERIINAAKALVDACFAKSLAQIAVECGMSKQYFTDLKKDKSNVSLSFLDDFCTKYPVSKAYLIDGNGEPLTINSPVNWNSNIANNIGGNNNQNSGFVIEALTQQLQEKDRQIQEQQKIAAKSQEQIDRLLTIIEKMNPK